MRRSIRYITHSLLAATVMACVTSCKGLIERYDDAICEYNVQLRYNYNRENTSSLNVLTDYVSKLDEYIFDSDGVLFAVNPLQKDKCTGEWISELELPAGRYSVITWGNLHTTCNISQAQVGITRREEMLLTLNNPCAIYTGYQNNSDPLFYGYRTFTVTAKDISRIRVDMLHSHLVIKYRVIWRGTPPNTAGDYQMRLRQNPSEYTFMTEFISRDNECREHIPSDDDEYNRICSKTMHYIPRVLQSNVLSHRVNSSIDVDQRVEGEIVAFRLRNGTPAILSFYEIIPTRAGYSERKMMNDVDLSSYFSYHEVNLDHELRQEYPMEFIIGEDGTVTVLPLSISDWDEGGML